MAKFYSLDVINASSGFCVYRDTTWSKVKVGKDVKVEIQSNPKSIAIDPYSRAIKTKLYYFTGYETVGYIPREISQYVCFLSGKKVLEFMEL